MKANDICLLACETLIERGGNYDKDEERSMPTIVEAFKAVTGHDLTVQQGYLFMILLKAVRSQQGADKLDNWVDMAAYAALSGEECADGE